MQRLKVAVRDSVESGQMTTEPKPVPIAKGIQNDTGDREYVSQDLFITRFPAHPDAGAQASHEYARDRTNFRERCQAFGRYTRTTDFGVMSEHEFYPSRSMHLRVRSNRCVLPFASVSQAA